MECQIVCLDVALWHASKRSGLLLFIVECQLPSLSFIWEQSEVNIEGTVESVMMDIFFFIRLMYFWPCIVCCGCTFQKVSLKLESVTWLFLSPWVPSLSEHSKGTSLRQNATLSDKIISTIWLFGSKSIWLYIISSHSRAAGCPIRLLWYQPWNHIYQKEDRKCAEVEARGFVDSYSIVGAGMERWWWLRSWGNDLLPQVNHLWPTSLIAGPRYMKGNSTFRLENKLFTESWRNRLFPFF